MEIFWPSGGTLGPCVVWHCEEFVGYFVVALNIQGSVWHSISLALWWHSGTLCYAALLRNFCGSVWHSQGLKFYGTETGQGPVLWQC